MLVLLFATALLASCGGGGSTWEDLRLVQIRPRLGTEVLLNEDLILGFSAEVEPSSVSGESVSLVDETGAPARGRWLVERKQIRFLPEPALSPDLSDGGLRPGRQYTLTLAGFPRLDAVRGRGGEVLERTLVWRFATVEANHPAPFLDLGSGSSRLRLSQDSIGPADPIRLWRDEPIDPRSLIDANFDLRPQADPSRLLHVDVRLIENREASEAGPGEWPVVLELMPRVALEPGAYVLRVLGDTGLRDLGGRSVPFLQSHVALEFHVVPVGEDRLRIEFLDELDSIPLEVPWADGTASWGSSGRLSVRYPRAAGDGRLGDYELGEREQAPDLHTRRLRLPEGRTCTLAGGPGLRVLRAQGRVEIDGTLVRALEGPLDPMRVRRDEGPPGVDGPLPLSEWLADALARDPSWTVVIAGGDLVVRGAIQVETPLLLVAGGHIRVYGRARAAEDQLRLLGKGGGSDLNPTASPADLLWIDPPLRSPLARGTSLTFAALSTSLPRDRAVERWLAVEARGSTSSNRSGGRGAWRVGFLSVGDPVTPESVRWDLSELDRPGQVRLVFELLVHDDPGGRPWDPPFLDSVELTWDSHVR